MKPALILLVIILILLAYWRFVYFFRDPKRITPVGNNIISPADGIIVYIRKLQKNQIPISIKNKKEMPLSEITKAGLNNEFTDGYIIGIFMSLFDVHINRAPISGKIEKVFYFSGGKNLSMVKLTINNLLRRKKILPYDADYLIQNERNTILMRGDFPICVVQIADQYVHKIQCWAKEGNSINKGSKLGLIRMGSQVDIIIPSLKNLNIIVKEGDHVKAGEDILATY